MCLQISLKGQAGTAERTAYPQEDHSKNNAIQPGKHTPVGDCDNDITLAAGSFPGD